MRDDEDLDKRIRHNQRMLLACLWVVFLASLVSVIAGILHV